MSYVLLRKQFRRLKRACWMRTVHAVSYLVRWRQRKIAEVMEISLIQIVDKPVSVSIECRKAQETVGDVPLH
jgi:hypothetical protein